MLMLQYVHLSRVIKTNPSQPKLMSKSMNKSTESVFLTIVCSTKKKYFRLLLLSIGSFLMNIYSNKWNILYFNQLYLAALERHIQKPFWSPAQKCKDLKDQRGY